MPHLKYIFFSGKGGVGKSTISAATAYWFAKKGEKVCVFSIDPQASLSDIFHQDIFGRGEVEVYPNLYALEVDVDSRISKYQSEFRKALEAVYGQPLPEELEEYIGGMVADPAMTISAISDEVANLVLSNKYDRYIFDMIPHGYSLRFFSLIDSLRKWADDFREKLGAKDLEKQLSYVCSRLDAILNILRNREETAFFHIITPEKLVILDSKVRFDNSLRLES